MRASIPKLLGDLASIVGSQWVRTAPAELETYASDATPAKRSRPGVVVLPGTREEVVAIVRLLHQHRIPFVARGAGTGLSGGAIAGPDSVLLTLTRLNRILEVDAANRRAVVETGVVNSQLSTEAGRLGLHYAPDPSSQTVCTIGGNIAENAGGPHCLKHGVTTNHILELEIVLPDGTVATLGSPNGEPWGPDLVGLFVGSEGMFGVATRATVRLVPVPTAVRTLLADFESLRQAGEAVSAIIKSGIVPAALEMMDRNCIAAVEASIYAAGYPTDAGAVLLVELDGQHEAPLVEEAAEIEAILRAHGSRSIRSATDETTRTRLWQGRKKAFGAMGRIDRDLVVQDTVVPRSALPDVLEHVERIGNEFGISISNVFHAGDGNLHPNISFNAEDPDQMERVEKAESAIVDVCVKAGGTITGEHGVGLEKIRYMERIFDRDTLEAMCSVRRVFDPLGIANPGKVLPATTRWSTHAEEVRDRDAGRSQGVAEAHLSLERRIRGLLGHAATVEADPSGLPRVAPQNEEALSLLMQAASKDGWRVRIDGTGQWMPADAPADVVVTTQCFNDVSYFNPADLVATAGAGMSWRTLQHHLADQGAWVALDPPGTQRSVGSVVATGSAGPLRGCYGNVRDHVLGLTLVTGDGRVLRAGGIVVKNVAGFDLVKLATGSFGGFGIVTSATFRLRSVPRANVTLLGTGPRDRLIEAARDVLAAGLTPAALELLSPDVAGTPDWELAIRLVGSDAEVATTRDAVRGATSVILSNVAPDDASELWNSILAGTTRHPTTIRLGALPSSIDRALDLTIHHLGEGCTTASVGVGVIRWSGNATPGDLRRVRHTAAQQEIPLTLERAPWATRAAVGLFGAYREGGGPLVHGIRRAFDPAGIIVAPLESDP